MSNLYICEYYETPYEEGYRVVRTIEEHNKQVRTDAIDEFAHILKETFNNESPSNYHCTQPYFTLDNVRVLTDAVAKEMEGQKE